MKKDLVFAPAMIAVGVLLFLLRATGMTAHIIVSILGIVILAAYTVISRKEWKIPAFEIVMRAFYGIALISGVVILKIHGILALAIIHKASAALFAVLLIFLFIHKLVAKNTNKN